MDLRRIARVSAVALAVSLAAATAILFASEDVRWRAAVVGEKATGSLADVSWPELVPMLLPGSTIRARQLATTPNPHAVLRNPYTSPDDRQAGAETFVTLCSACHGAKGEGQTALKLIDRSLRNGDSDWALFRSITNGLPELGMPPAPLTDVQVWQVVGHVRALRAGAAELGANARRPPTLRVPAARLEAAADEPQNWLTYSGSYRSWRRTALSDINTDNVADLKLAWSLQLDTPYEGVETSPLVVDGVMYLSVPPSDVLAVDAASGRPYWRYERKIPSGVSMCCGAVNRGVAVLGERVFIGTLDGYLVALDSQTGKLVWESQVADYREGYSITAAPLAVRDKIIVGVSGGEFGVRGFLDAYDAVSGQRAWRFYTVPHPGEPGSESWSGDTWRTGGGPTWLTGSFDPALGLLYWGTGNPSPNFNGDNRAGDNLYTNSVIALDVDSGALAWHFQFTPHDEHDWDSNQIPVLVDHEYEGQPRRLMLWANRNGFYYVLDRETGEFLHAVPFVTVNWARGIDANGRPILTPEAAPSEAGTLTWPGLAGGTNWWAPSYSPEADLLYVPFSDSPRVFFKDADLDDEPSAGLQFLEGSAVASGHPRRAGIRALEPVTGRVAWEHVRREPRSDLDRIGGTLATAGNLVFFGDVTEFVAVDARDGRELWRVNLGGEVIADPVSFAVDGAQRVAIAAGKTLFVFRR